MGIDFSHCEAHWSYGGFNSARTRLAATVDIVLGEMQGFGGSIPWDKFDDPITSLLNHSDCDGCLSPDECSSVAPRLTELVWYWPEHDFDRQKFLELAEGMYHAWRANEPLQFL